MSDAVHSSAEIAETNNLSSPLTVVSYPGVLDESDVGTQRGVRAWVKRLFSTLRATVSPDRGSAGSIFGKSPGDLDRGRSRWVPALIVLACIAVASGFLYFKASLSPALTAGILLERAALAEQIVQESRDRINHRLINLEERRSTEGAIVARRRIEIWQHPANGNSAHRLYDDSNQLIAGVWQKSDGARTVFHHGSKPRSETAFITPADLLLNLEDIWQVEPSAQAFAALITDPAAVEVEERATTYVLTYRRSAPSGASRAFESDAHV